MNSVDTKARTFEGWISTSVNQDMVWAYFTPKPWEETDIDIRVTHCGVCGSDVHVLHNGWGSTDYPVIVGQEIIGIAVRVGTRVDANIKVGDRVGVGAQSDSCLCRKPPDVAEDWSDCTECATGKENWCRRASTTYNSTFHSAAAFGAQTMGGYARYHRCPSHFVFKIPPGLRSEHAAPMMCAGATVYGALFHAVKGGGSGLLERHLDGLSIGIVGIGGLGHLAIMFAKAMGAANIVAISRYANKHEDALKLGADDYIAMDEEINLEKYKNGLDLIISTISQTTSTNSHLHLLRRGGRYVMVGMPSDRMLQVDAAILVLKQVEITGSLIASPAELRRMLQFVTDNSIKPLIEVMDMKKANDAVRRVDAGEARYRIVLRNGGKL